MIHYYFIQNIVIQKKHNSRAKNINHEGNQQIITHKNPPNNYHVQNLSGNPTAIIAKGVG